MRRKQKKYRKPLDFPQKSGIIKAQQNHRNNTESEKGKQKDMIKVVNNRTERKPYADTKHHYEVVTDGETEEEVRKFCTESVHRCSKSDLDARGWSESFYNLFRISANRYRYTVVVPNCD